MTSTDRSAVQRGATPSPDPAPPAIEPEELRRLGYRAVDLVVDHLAGIRGRPVFQAMSPDERQALLEQPLPIDGTAPDEILDQIATQVMPRPMGNGHPRFFGYINSPPSPIAVLAELLAATLNPSCAGGDHAAIYLERTAVRWLMELVGFPTRGSMGLLVSGGSTATLTCLAAARQRVSREDGWDPRNNGLQGDRRRLRLYLAEAGHSCIRKAAEIMGLGQSALRTVGTDDRFRMDVAELRRAVAEDRAAGWRPFCVAASAGAVATGAIDPLDALADLCAEEGLWLHVDGAYGAIAVLDPAVADRFRGLGRADSLGLDPHKWLSVPVECGCALVGDGALLRETFSLVPAYLQTEEGKGFGGLPWYSEYGFQQTRGFGALKLWAALRHEGRAGLAARIARHNRQAHYLADLVDAAPNLERLAPVELSIVCFRYAPPTLQGDEDRLAALNQRIMQDVQAGGEAFLTQAVLHGQFALRACIVHYDTTGEDVQALVDVVRRVGARLAS